MCHSGKFAQSISEILYVLPEGFWVRVVHHCVQSTFFWTWGKIQIPDIYELAWCLLPVFYEVQISTFRWGFTKIWWLVWFDVCSCTTWPQSQRDNDIAKIAIRDFYSKAKWTEVTTIVARYPFHAAHECTFKNSQNTLEHFISFYSCFITARLQHCRV